MKRMVVLRRLSQIFFFSFFVYVLWSTTYPLTGLIHPSVLFKLDPFIMILTAISQRVLLPGLIYSLCMMILALVLGRFFCGWICPLGSFIDLTGSFRKKPRTLSDKENSFYRKIKFYILGFCFVFALFAKQIAWIFDPIVITARFVSMNMIPAITGFINSLFIFLIKYMNIDGRVVDTYHALKATVLGVKIFYFEHSAAILAVFMIVCFAALILRRSWCRIICPLGAIYSLLGRFAPFHRIVDKCAECGKCKSGCRTGAIRDDLGYAQGECVLCMDCVYDCPVHATHFRFGPQKIIPVNVSRKNFLLLLFGLFPLFGAKFQKSNAVNDGAVIRPPAALKEEDFVNRCIRCGNCMKVCITNGLHPSMLQAGIGAIWTPVLIPEIGYCEYRCTLCGRTCPTGALPALSLEEKLVTRLGLARVDKSICLPWAEGKECIVCQEHCPVAEKAIKLDTYAGLPARPYVDEHLCVGCGICQNKCPVRPVRAIRVTPKNADRI